MTTGVERGVVSATVTPFDSHGQPHLKRLEQLLEFQLDAGIRSFLLLGTAGEGLLCQPHERKAIVDSCLSLVNGRAAVLVNCSAADSWTAQDLATHAERAGAQGVAVTAPLFYPFSPAALYRHFSDVAESAPNLDHYVYENPAKVGLEIGPNLVNRMVHEIEPIVGVKDTGDNLSRIMEYSVSGADTRVFVGGNNIILASLQVGAWGAVSALTSAVPELLVALDSAFRRGKFDSARDLQLDVASLGLCLRGMPYVAAVKHLAGMRGLDVGPVRAPLDGMTPSEVERLEESLDRAGLRRWLQLAA